MNSISAATPIIFAEAPPPRPHETATTVYNAEEDAIYRFDGKEWIKYFSHAIMKTRRQFFNSLAAAVGVARLLPVAAAASPAPAARSYYTRTEMDAFMWSFPKVQPPVPTRSALPVGNHWDYRFALDEMRVYLNVRGEWRLVTAELFADPKREYPRAA